MYSERFKSVEGRTVVLGVAASDAHAVANHLIAHDLRARGYHVVNLGVCTPIAEFAAAVREHPDTLAVVIGSVNGHAYEDLHDLPAARKAGQLMCPVVVGGNLWVGSQDDRAATDRRLRTLGVDHVLDSVRDLPVCLADLARRRPRSLGWVS